MYPPRAGCIAVALGLPQLKILWQRELESHIEVTVIYRRDKATCPQCGEVTNKEHDRRQQLKQDRRLRDKARLNQLFYRYPELKKGWVLKQSFCVY